MTLETIGDQMRILLIRHGITKGNREHRYVGSTDEGLLTGERERLLALAETGKYKADIVVVSPMRRCIETAEVFNADTCNFLVVDSFREMNFGVFEYMTYDEINQDPDETHRDAYQRYIDTMGETAFPGGESKKEFIERVSTGFKELLTSDELMQKKTIAESDLSKTSVRGTETDKFTDDITIALFVHGGTIMALMDRFSYPHKDYFEWSLKPGEAYEMELIRDNDDIRFTEIKKI